MALDRGDGVVELADERHVSGIGPASRSGHVVGMEPRPVPDEGVRIGIRVRVDVGRIDDPLDDVVDVVVGPTRRAAWHEGLVGGATKPQPAQTSAVLEAPDGRPSRDAEDTVGRHAATTAPTSR